MRLLREFIMPDDGLTQTVVREEKETKKKDIYIKGVFLQADVKNRNGRIYPSKLMEREVFKLNERILSKSKLLGELDHPSTHDYKLSDAAFQIVSLKRDPSNPNNYMGEAKVLRNTTKGGTLYALCMDAGCEVGVSSRALGTLEEAEDGSGMIVQDDLNMITIDAVADPSAPDAWVQSIYESTDYYIENGIIKENEASKIKREIDKIYSNPKSRDMLKEKVNKAFNDFLNNI